MKKYVLTALLIVLSTSVSVNAQELSFFEALNELVKDCPQITILKKNNEATIEAEKQLNKLSSPEVEVDQVWGRHGVGNKFDVTVSQGFDWPSLYKARARAITAQTNANTLLEQAQLLEKTQEVKTLMVDIIYQKKHIEISKMIVLHMEEMEKVNRRSFEKGETSKLEFKRTELERVQASIQLREDERVLKELYSQLEAATGKTDCVAIMNRVKDVPDWVVAPEENYEQNLSSYDPRMAYLKATIEAIDASSKSEKMAATMPSFNLGYLYQREQGETFNGFSVSLTLPIYGSNHVKNASKANIIAAQLEAQVEQITILSKMRNQRAAALSLAKELDDYSTIFEKGNYSELLKMALEGGQTDNIHYLQELNFYIEVTRQYLELQHQYNLALVGLNRFEIFNEDGRNF